MGETEVDSDAFVLGGKRLRVQLNRKTYKVPSSGIFENRGCFGSRRKGSTEANIERLLHLGEEEFSLKDAESMGGVGDGLVTASFFETWSFVSLGETVVPSLVKVS